MSDQFSTTQVGGNTTAQPLAIPVSFGANIASLDDIAAAIDRVVERADLKAAAKAQPMPEVSANASTVMHFIARHGMESGDTWVTLGHKIGMDPGEVLLAFSDLQRAGYLKVQPQ